MPGFLQPLMTFLSADLMSSTVYLAILIIFIMAMIKCITPVMNNRRLLKRAVRRLRKGDKSRASWQEPTFLGKGSLYPHWQEYLNNLFFADGEFHNPSNLEDYINEDTAIYSPGRAMYADVAPGLMVSLGFLGTLMGISAGLSGFSMDDADQVMTAIRQLVPGMQYAFMTSIIGVIGSISTTIITRIAHGAAHNALQSFYEAMTHSAGVQSVDPMTQIAIYQQEQTTLLQGIARDLSGATAERLAGALTGAMTRSLDDMRDSMESFMNFSTHEQMRGIDLLINRFIQQMNTSMDGQFTNLSRTIEQTCSMQQKISEGLSGMSNSLQSMVENAGELSELSTSMVDALAGCAKNVQTNAKQTDDAYARIASNVEHLEIIAHQQNSYLLSVSALQNDMNKSVAAFEASSQDVMQAFSENARSSSQALAEASQSLKESSTVLAANHKALVGGISKDIDQTYNNFFRSTNEAIANLTQCAQNLQTSVARMPETVEGLSALYTHQIESLADALRKAQSALDNAIEQLTNAHNR